MNRFLACFLLLVSTTMGYSQDIPLSQILVPSENWKKTTLSNLSALASDSQGALFLANSKTKSISKLDSNGKTTDVVMDAPAKALALDSLGGIYLADKSGAKKKVNTEDAVISLAVSNDETTLFAGSADGRSVFTFRIEQNGDITAKDRYVAPRKPLAGVTGSVPGMTLDKANRIYAATSLGVQVFDPTGRLCGVLLQPDFPSFASSIAFAGSDKSTLYALVGQNLYTRKILFPGK